MNEEDVKTLSNMPRNAIFLQQQPLVDRKCELLQQLLCQCIETFCPVFFIIWSF
jgi:hypothetical protein